VQNRLRRDLEHRCLRPEAESDLLGRRQPAPAHHGGVRNGDNLYANSVVARDALSGKLRWHYQFTPAHENDWDAVQQPVLAQIQWQGEPCEVVLWANRNGFFSALDRDSGKFLSATAFVKQTWSDGFDVNGRPMRGPAQGRPAPARSSGSGSVAEPLRSKLGPSRK